MDTNTSNLTQDQIDALVKELSDNFDITKLQVLSYEDIQKVAQKYLDSDNPEYREIGEELKTIDPKIFELTPAETSLKQLHDIVMKLGKSKYDADRFGISVLEVAIEGTVQKIVGEMNSETKNQWDDLLSYEPNAMQQMYLLNETSKLLLGKDFDAVYEENLEKTVKLAAQLLSEKREKAELAQSLTEEQATTVLTAFNANQYEIAIQLIYNFAQENGSN